MPWEPDTFLGTVAARGTESVECGAQTGILGVLPMNIKWTADAHQKTVEYNG